MASHGLKPYDPDDWVTAEKLLDEMEKHDREVFNQQMGAGDQKD